MIQKSLIFITPKIQSIHKTPKYKKFYPKNPRCKRISLKSWSKIEIYFLTPIVSWIHQRLHAGVHNDPLVDANPEINFYSKWTKSTRLTKMTHKHHWNDTKTKYNGFLSKKFTFPDDISGANRRPVKAVRGRPARMTMSCVPGALTLDGRGPFLANREKQYSTFLMQQHINSSNVTMRSHCRTKGVEKKREAKSCRESNLRKRKRNTKHEKEGRK